MNVNAPLRCVELRYVEHREGWLGAEMSAEMSAEMVFGPHFIPELPTGIAVAAGEVAIRFDFSFWLVGPITDMIAYLRSIHPRSVTRREWAASMASQIEARAVARSPTARLARALGLPAEQVADMAEVARVSIVEEAPIDRSPR